MWEATAPRPLRHSGTARAGRPSRLLRAAERPRRRDLRDFDQLLRGRDRTQCAPGRAVRRVAMVRGGHAERSRRWRADLRLVRQRIVVSSSRLLRPRERAGKRRWRNTAHRVVERHRLDRRSESRHAGPRPGRHALRRGLLQPGGLSRRRRHRPGPAGSRAEPRVLGDGGQSPADPLRCSPPH